MSIFTDVRVRKPKRTKKNMSFTSLVTSRFGAVTPILCKEVYPNETWKETPQVLCRMTPLIVPLMSKMEIRVDYFFVPNRILWTDWEEFITRGIDGMSEVEKPMLPLSQLLPYNGSLTDYLNFPTVPYNGGNPSIPGGFSEPVDLLPFAGYRRIWQDWYADETLQESDMFEFPMSTAEMIAACNDNPQVQTKPVLQRLMTRGWKKDYFTSALPWAQRGPEVVMNTEIYGTGGQIGSVSGRTQSSANLSASGVSIDDGQGLQFIADSDYSPNGFVGATVHGSSERVHLSHTHAISDQPVHSDEGTIEGLEGEGFTVNEFRRLVALQEWFETNARAGGRYIESILAHFGLRVPDYRLDRSEYIGGVTNEFSFGEVLQTSSNNDSTGQALGAYAGRGISLVQGRIKKYRVPEHGWLFGIMSIRPKRNAYYQGIPRQYSRATALDYMFPRFANLGEQAIKNKEIYAHGNGEGLDDDFGYVPRFSELYGSMDELHGEMRGSLLYWHTARKFDNMPTLSKSLIEIMNNSASQLNRIFAYDDGTAVETLDSSNDHFILEVHQTIKAKRCLPVSPIPGTRV